MHLVRNHKLLGSGGSMVARLKLKGKAAGGAKKGAAEKKTTEKKVAEKKPGKQLKTEEPTRRQPGRRAKSKSPSPVRISSTAVEKPKKNKADARTAAEAASFCKKSEKREKKK